MALVAPVNARFEGRVALVTGAAGGIGRAIAQRLRGEGALLVLVDQQVQDLPPADAAQCLAVMCDVSREEQVAAAVASGLERWGRLDVIVNNAGLMTFKPLEQLGAQDWNRILGVDLLGAFFFIKQAFLHMKPGGVIVNVASIHADRTTPMVAPYAAAKAAMLSLTRSAALEGRPRGLRCNAILPGAVDTPMLRDNPEVKAGVERIDPGELLHPSDIAAAVAFLASDDAAFVQGAGLIVDGGRLGQL